MVLGTSVAQRLPGGPHLAADLLQHCLTADSRRHAPMPTPGSASASNAQLAAGRSPAREQAVDEAGEDRAAAAGPAAGPEPCCVSQGLQIPHQRTHYVQQLYQQAQASQPAGDSDLGTSKSTEWLIRVQAGHAAAAHSLYVKASLGELRLASCVSAPY